jgi:hypothetical protein
VAPHQVALFLQIVRDARDNDRLAFRGDRAKNIQALIGLGLKPSDVLDAVTDLTPEQALGVPRTNEFPRFVHEQVCEFGLDLQEALLYVKVAAGVDEQGSAGCVISFHPAESPLRYPFKQH